MELNRRMALGGKTSSGSGTELYLELSTALSSSASEDG